MNAEPASKADLLAVKHELMEFSRDLQTELLRGIERLLIPAEARLVRAEAKLGILDANDGSMNERIASVEARLWEIEKRLLMRPPETGA